MPYEAIVIGVSAGGFDALKAILPALPEGFSTPIIIVQHIAARTDNFMADYFNNICAIAVKEAEDKEPISAGCAYLAPAGYHLLIEPDTTFSLSADPRVNYSCPSIDVLFESAADVFKQTLIGMVLTGANADGAQGLKRIKQCGGVAIVQDPAEAEARAMPQAALAATQADYVAKLENIAPLLSTLCNPQEEAYGTRG